MKNKILVTGSNGLVGNALKKILGDDNIRVTATAVRIPVMGGHSESVNVEFENDFEVYSDGRTLTFGHIRIDTDPLADDYDEE